VLESDTETCRTTRAQSGRSTFPPIFGLEKAENVRIERRADCPSLSQRNTCVHESAQYVPSVEQRGRFRSCRALHAFVQRQKHVPPEYLNLTCATSRPRAGCLISRELICTNFAGRQTVSTAVCASARTQGQCKFRGHGKTIFVDFVVYEAADCKTAIELTLL